MDFTKVHTRTALVKQGMLHFRCEKHTPVKIDTTTQIRYKFCVRNTKTKDICNKIARLCFSHSTTFYNRTGQLPICSLILMLGIVTFRSFTFYVNV